MSPHEGYPYTIFWPKNHDFSRFSKMVFVRKSHDRLFVVFGRNNTFTKVICKTIMFFTWIGAEWRDLVRKAVYPILLYNMKKVSSVSFAPATMDFIKVLQNVMITFLQARNDFRNGWKKTIFWVLDDVLWSPNTKLAPEILRYTPCTI